MLYQRKSTSVLRSNDFNVSKITAIREIAEAVDIIILQETLTITFQHIGALVYLVLMVYFCGHPCRGLTILSKKICDSKSLICIKLHAYT